MARRRKTNHLAPIEEEPDEDGERSELTSSSPSSFSSSSLFSCSSHPSRETPPEEFRSPTPYLELTERIDRMLSERKELRSRIEKEKERVRRENSELGRGIGEANRELRKGMQETREIVEQTGSRTIQETRNRLLNERIDRMKLGFLELMEWIEKEKEIAKRRN